MPAAPPSALIQGTKLTVGSHEVEIDRFIGEGGFAHVYTVKTTPPIPGHEVACLKRVQVPTKAYLNLLRAEVDAMQRLKGSSNIVQYFDSHAERMRNPPEQGHYEVFLLMEFCDGGGLIDFMNTRLRDRLREHEILKIMYDITLGLAHMHYLTPPLLHRDLKIENVLIAKDGSFKLCDFGSVSPVLRPPKTPQEFKILEDDIQHQTTVQYRAPEMVAIARGHPIDEKSDIWALGIFLYKLCYYTTPFERPNQTLDQFQQLILAGVFTIPPRPAYSERLRNMIRVLLQPDPRFRPNAFQVMQEICAMRHVECPIEDIYSRATHQFQVQPQPQPQMPQAQQPLQPAPLAAQSMAAPQMSAGALHPLLTADYAGLRPSLPPRPAPGQVPVPGVLLTSPMATPTSPVSRAVSPLDDQANVTARFPSLEELDLADSADLVDFNHRKPSSSGRLSRKQPLQQQNPQSQLSIDSSEDDDDDYPMPQRPTSLKPQSTEAQKLKQILTSISGKSSTVVLDNPQERNLSSVDFLRTLQTSESSHNPHHSLKTHIHKSHKSKFYRSEDEDDDDEDDDDDVRLAPAKSERDYQGRTHDFKRESYSPESYSPEHYSPRSYALDQQIKRDNFVPSDPEDSFNFSGSGSVSPLASPSHIIPVSPKKPLIHIGASAEVSLPKLLPSKLPAKLPTKLPAKLPTKNSTKVLMNIPPSASSKPKLELNRTTKVEDGGSPSSVSSDSQIVAAPPAKPHISSKPMRVVRGKLISHSPTAPSAETFRTRPRPRPKSMLVGSNERASHTTSDLDAFRPSNSIQQRVHSFLSSHDRQHQIRRTARGYGRFTDPADSNSDVDTDSYSTLSDFGSLRTTRSKSVDGGVPRPPSRASKPKLKQ